MAAPVPMATLHPVTPEDKEKIGRPAGFTAGG